MQQETLFATPRIEGVSAVVNYIGRVLRANKQLKALAVRGEVSNLRKVAGGRLYFDLKEGRDMLACVVWENRAVSLPPFKNGDELIASGDFGIFSDHSKYQLVVNAVQLSGVGNLHAQIEALRLKFRAEGLFEAARKRPMPPFPTRVALVSAAGKGKEDFFETAARRAPHLRITFVETRVQGVGAQIDIAEAVDRASRLPVDVIVLARGGGSFEDLFPFNLEPVVRAIVRARVPVLTGIGHTGDHHLADDVADKSVQTPSNAAQYFGELRDASIGQLARLEGALDQAFGSSFLARYQQKDALMAALRSAAQHFPSQRRDVLAGLERRLDAKNPLSALQERRTNFERLAARLAACGSVAIGRSNERYAQLASRFAALPASFFVGPKHRIELLIQQLGACDPHLPLSRGYAMLKQDGHVVTEISQVTVGSQIDATLAAGTITARVERVDQHER